MYEVKLNLDETGRGAFYLNDGTSQLAEMVVGVSGQNLTVYHTEVAVNAEGKGLAKMLLNAMVDYARSKSLKVNPLCPFVHLQFKRNSEAYVDVWNQGLKRQDG